MHWLDWTVVALSCVLVFIVGLWFARKSSQGGLASYFAGDRDLPWWAIGLSNTATYQSGNGAFVMFVLIHGLVGNWLWWSSWIIWMPLAAVMWARLWQRAGVVSVAELMAIRYGGQAAQVTRKVYAAMCFFTSILVIAYITGFFILTIEPLSPFKAWQVLLIFGGCTVAYTMFGGLLGVVYSDVAQFFIMFAGCVILLFLAVPQFGGWGHILRAAQANHPSSLTALPPTKGVETLTVVIFAIQGLFTIGDGTTSQRFIAARSERHAVAGQLFNAFLSLSIRVLPLIGLGLICAAVFYTPEQADAGPVPAGVTVIGDKAHAWGELVKRCTLPTGFVGLLVAAEVAAYMSTLSSHINWGSSLVVNDILPRRLRESSAKITISRLTVLFMFVVAAVMTMLFVKDMESWFMFINGAMGMFTLTLGVMRFCWWRFNVWGELASIVLGMPIGIVIWFLLDFQSKPAWQGLMLLGGMGVVTMTLVALLTPPESMDVLQQFYRRCRPPGFWGPVRASLPQSEVVGISWQGAMMSSILGVLSCFGLVMVTNAMYIGDWWQIGIGTVLCLGAGGWLLRRVM